MMAYMSRIANYELINKNICLCDCNTSILDTCNVFSCSAGEFADDETCKGEFICFILNWFYLMELVST
jgi:hypothetical protein